MIPLSEIEVGDLLYNGESWWKVIRGPHNDGYYDYLGIVTKVEFADENVNSSCRDWNWVKEIKKAKIKDWQQVIEND